MKLISAATAALALAACSNPQPVQQKAEQGAAQRPSDADSEAYIRKAEEDWAQLFVRDDPTLLRRILADDFSGVFSSGSVHNKAQAIPNEKPDRTFKSARLDYVNYRHFGDVVVAQGVESAQRRDGGPDLRLIWTDIWAFRDGKWQVVATHVSNLPRGREAVVRQANATDQARQIEVIRGTGQKSSSSITPAPEIEVIRGTGRRSEPAKERAAKSQESKL